MCLYGLPNETWEVNLPVEEVPPELPEPALGINFARDGMQEKYWLSLVAVHSDSWLLAVAFYFGARFGFNKSDRYFLEIFYHRSYYVGMLLIIYVKLMPCSKSLKYAVTSVRVADYICVVLMLWYRYCHVLSEQKD